MSELEIFAEMTNNQGGEWSKLEDNENYTLYVSKTKYMSQHNYYYNAPVYQIFNNDGKRLYVSTDYKSAYGKYQNILERM